MPTEATCFGAGESYRILAASVVDNSWSFRMSEKKDSFLKWGDARYENGERDRDHSIRYHIGSSAAGQPPTSELENSPFMCSPLVNSPLGSVLHLMMQPDDDFFLDEARTFLHCERKTIPWR